MGPAGGIFGDGVGFQTFGGPGIRIHQFGGPRRRQQRAGTTRQEVPAQDQGLMRMLVQLLPLIIFFLLPILGSLFTGDGSEKLRGPSFKLDHNPPYTAMRETPNLKIPYWVNPNDLRGMKKAEIANLDKRAESTIINGLRYKCQKEQEEVLAEKNAAYGWLFVDQEKLKKANERPMPNCQKLRDLGINGWRAQ